ncbi:hypothetical protein HED48_18660 [Ochrobactrum intermedium]|nr:hypothetical protein [Brucella intermedia]
MPIASRTCSPRADGVQRGIDSVMTLLECLETGVEAIPAVVEAMQGFLAGKALDGAVELIELTAERLRIGLTAAVCKMAHAVTDALEVFAYPLREPFFACGALKAGHFAAGAADLDIGCIRQRLFMAFAHAAQVFGDFGEAR